MSKKMKLPPLFNHKNPPQHKTSVPSSTRHSWVPCREQPKTLSFRATMTDDLKSTTELSSGLQSLSESTSLSQDSGDEAVELENVIRGVRKSSERLFFSPEKSNFIVEKTLNHKHSMQENAPSTVTIESLDPYMDFRTSMEEMVQAHDLHDWELLEELLGCYLMVNDKTNHFYIIRAFVDLVATPTHIVHLTSSSGCCSSPSLISDSFVTSSSPHVPFSSSSTTAETSCSSSSLTPAEAPHVVKAGHSETFNLHQLCPHK